MGPQTVDMFKMWRIESVKGHLTQPRCREPCQDHERQPTKDLLAQRRSKLITPLSNAFCTASASAWVNVPFATGDAEARAKRKRP